MSQRRELQVELSRDLKLNSKNRLFAYFLLRFFDTWFLNMSSGYNNTSDESTSSVSTRLVSETCMDLFLIEMVDTICRTTTAEADGDSDAIFYKLETLGYAVGQRLVERFTKDRPRFVDTLDVVKFICKDLWTIMFKKQIDNLKTNHRVNRCKQTWATRFNLELIL